MKLRQLCKDATSVPQDKCAAVYVADDATKMVGQGKVLDAGTTAELLHLAADESAVAMPIETVLRGVGLYMAEQGHPDVLTEVTAFLAERGW